VAHLSREVVFESPAAPALTDLDSIVDYYGHGRKVNLVGHLWGAMLASAFSDNIRKRLTMLSLLNLGSLPPSLQKI